MSSQVLHRGLFIAAILGVVVGVVHVRRSAPFSGQAVPRCGDGLVQAGVEQCDDGNTNPGDGCNAVCYIEPPPGCGNGVVTPPEQCDDWNQISGDGCTPDCKREELTNNAQCIGITAPASVTAGQSFTATVTMKNTGTKPWNTPNHYLYDVDWKNGGFTSMRWGVATAQLPTSPVASSATAVFSIAVTAPAQVGSYTFQWAMLENGVGYFGATCTKTITVTAATSSSRQSSSSVPPVSSRVSSASSLVQPSPSSVIPEGYYGLLHFGKCSVLAGPDYPLLYPDPACDDRDPCTQEVCMSCSHPLLPITPQDCLPREYRFEPPLQGVCQRQRLESCGSASSSSSSSIMSVCGDGIVDANGADNVVGNADDESCDDGNTTNGDGCSSTCKREGECNDGRDNADRDSDADCRDIGCIDPESQVGSAVRCDPDGTTETDRWDEAGDTLPNFFDLPSLIRNPSVELKSDTSVSLFFRRLLGQAAPPAQNACVEAGGIVMESTFRISNNLPTVDIKKNSCAGKAISYTFPQKISPTQDALSARGAIAQGCYSGCNTTVSAWMRDFVLATAKEQEKPSLQNGRIHRIELEWCRADCVCQGAKDDATDTKKRIQDTAQAKRDDVQAQYAALVLQGSPEQVAEAAKWSRQTLANIAAKEKEDLDALQNVMDGAAGQCFQQCMTGQRLQAACPAREPDCCSAMCISTVCPVQRPTAVTNMRYISLCQYLAQVALPCGQGPGGPGSTTILSAASSSSTAATPVAAVTSSSSVPSLIDVSPPVPDAPPTSQGASSLSVVISARSESFSSRSSRDSSVRSSAPSSAVSNVSSVRQSSSTVLSSRVSSAAPSSAQTSSAHAVCPADPCGAEGDRYCASLGQQCRVLPTLPCFVCAARSIASSRSSWTLAFSQMSAPRSSVAGTLPSSHAAVTHASSVAVFASSVRSPAPPLVAVGSLPTDVLPALLVCGDGRIDSGEECDDGNGRDFDGCSADCLLERGRCGDGVVQSLLGEQCEPAAHSPALPYGCSAACRFVSTLCGDGVRDPGEQCDLGRQNSDVPDAYCREDCGLARCGDGIADVGHDEECDDGNRVRGDGCSSDCRTERGAGSPLAAQIFELAQPSRSSVPSRPQSPHSLARLPPQTAASGPGTLAVMAAGAAAGVAFSRRQRR